VASEHSKRLRQLQRSTPRELSGEVIRDQVYAQYQHERADLEHPNGGQWKYQETPLLEHGPEYVGKVADRLLEGETVDGMATAMAMFGEDSGELTPKDYEVLANSDRQRVVADGQVERDRPPDAPRLSAAELKDLHGKAVGRMGAGTGPNRKPPPGAKVTQKPRPY
jgi:hypothetical protein